MMYRHTVYMHTEPLVFVDIRGIYDIRVTIFRHELSDGDKNIYDNYTSFINAIGGKMFDIDDMNLPAEMFVDIYGDFMLNESHTTNDNFYTKINKDQLQSEHADIINSFFTLITSKYGI